jgi:hypothetical protein
MTLVDMTNISCTFYLPLTFILLGKGDNFLWLLQILTHILAPTSKVKVTDLDLALMNKIDQIVPQVSYTIC